MTTRVFVKFPVPTGGTPQPPTPTPQHVLDILALGPDVYFDFTAPLVENTYTMYQPNGEPVTELDQRIGSVRNLGSRKGFALAPSETASPLYKLADGARFDGSNDEMNYTSTLLAQPITHVLYLQAFQWTSGTAYYLDSQADSTQRHQAFGQGASFSTFSNGHLISAASTVNRFEWLAGNTERNNNRAVIIANEASSSFTMTGDFPFSTGTYNIGSVGMEGVLLGRGRVAGSTHIRMNLQAYARFPKVLSSGEIASLPALIGAP
jgi:hypothetical protein